jgi:hypothetical protein
MHVATVIAANVCFDAEWTFPFHPRTINRETAI